MVSFARRFASVAALLVLDLSGLALGLYGALTIREFYVGHSQPLWGLLWEAEENWLPFLALITALVFGQQGLYAPRERRAGSSRVLPALVLVALLTLAFAVGTGHDFSTFGLIPTAVVLSALCIGLFRASYETLAAALLHAAGARRRVVLIGHGPELERLREALGFSRGGIEYAFAGAVSEQPLGGDLPRLGSLEDLARVLRQQRVDEAIVADVDLSETQLLEIVEEAHRHGVRVRVAPKTTDLLAQRAEYVPGQGVPSSSSFGRRRSREPTGPSSGCSTWSLAQPSSSPGCRSGSSSPGSSRRPRPDRFSTETGGSASTSSLSRCSSSAPCTRTLRRSRAGSRTPTRRTGRSSSSATIPV